MIGVLGGVSFMLAGKATVLGGFVTPRPHAHHV